MARKTKTELEALTREATDYVFTSAIRLAIERIAEDIAKDALADETFKAALRALVQESAKDVLRSLGARP